MSVFLAPTSTSSRAACRTITIGGYPAPRARVLGQPAVGSLRGDLEHRDDADQAGAQPHRQDGWRMAAQPRHPAPDAGRRWIARPVQLQRLRHRPPDRRLVAHRRGELVRVVPARLAERRAARPEGHRRAGNQALGGVPVRQDKWQARPNITVDLGLRWEYYTPLTGVEGTGSLSNYDPAANTLRVAGYGTRARRSTSRSTFTNFNAAHRHLLAAEQRERRARRLRRQHDSVPGQSLRVQLPGQAELLGFGRQRLPERGFDGGRLPGADAREHSAGRHHPGHGIAARTRPTTLSRRTCAKARCTPGTSPFQRQLPYHFTADIAYVGNRGVEPGDGHRCKRQPGLRIGQRRTAAVRAVQPHRHVAHPQQREQVRVQRAADEGRPAVP